MMLSFLNFKKNTVPKLSSVRPPLFNIEKHWFFALGLFFAIFVITFLVGLQLFHTVYFETYKKEPIPEDYAELLNLNRLKSVVDKRETFRAQEVVLPRDPSM